MTIKLKLAICIDCDDNTPKPLIAKRCQYHYKLFRSKINKAKKVRTPIDLKSNGPNRVTDLVKWYESRMNEMTGRCMECGKPIPKWQTYRHAAIAHILPKSLFPSVATHPLNWLELGANCGCHARYDNSYLSASKMKIWPLAIERFLVFREFINTQEEIRKIPELLEKEIK